MHTIAHVCGSTGYKSVGTPGGWYAWRIERLTEPVALLRLVPLTGSFSPLNRQFFALEGANICLFWGKRVLLRGQKQKV